MVVPGAGIGEDARAVHALEERLSHRVLLGHHHVRVTAAKVVDVIDGAVDILDDLDTKTGVISVLIKLILTKLVNMKLVNIILPRWCMPGRRTRS